LSPTLQGHKVLDPCAQGEQEYYKPTLDEAAREDHLVILPGKDRRIKSRQERKGAPRVRWEI
jgi:hypothetical protein